jgi:histone H3/H4
MGRRKVRADGQEGDVPAKVYKRAPRLKTVYDGQLGVVPSVIDENEWIRVAPAVVADVPVGKGGRKPKKGGKPKAKQPRVAKSLPDTTLRRAVLVYGPKRVGGKALEELRAGVEDVVFQVVTDATRSAACEGRKTIKGRDTRRALKARGITLI